MAAQEEFHECWTLCNHPDLPLPGISLELLLGLIRRCYRGDESRVRPVQRDWVVHLEFGHSLSLHVDVNPVGCATCLAGRQFGHSGYVAIAIPLRLSWPWIPGILLLPDHCRDSAAWRG